MKRILSICLVLCMLLCFSPAAFAISPQFDLTKEITAAFDSDQIYYTLYGVIDDEDEEYLSSHYSGEYLDDIEIDIFVDKKYSSVTMYCFDFMEYDPSDFSDVLRAANKMNTEYNYVTFYCDEESNTVNVSVAGFLAKGAAGYLASELLETIVFVVDEAYNDIFYRYAA